MAQKKTETKPPETPGSAQKQPPVYDRWFGSRGYRAIHLRVWENRGEHGPFYRIDVVQKYKKDANDEEWQETTVIDVELALIAAEAYRIGWQWLEDEKDHDRQRARRRTRRA